MHRARTRLLTALTLAALTLAAVAPAASAVDPDSDPVVIATGLDNPRGIDIGANGVVAVAETGTGRVLRVDGGVRTLAAGFPLAVFDGSPVSVHNVSLTGSGNLFALVGEGEDEGFQSLERVSPSGRLSTLADIGAYQEHDPDPTDTEGFAEQSNPYGLESIGSGRVLVTDAGGNDLLLVTPNGRITTVARFPTEIVSTDHLPFPFPAPAIPAEAVPTTVAVGPDGYWYVGELKGFPFRPGSSNIWRIAPWARNATCDNDPSDGCSRWMTGFTSIVGIEFARDGSLYVAEMVKNGLIAAEGGDVVGALWHVSGGTRHEIAAGQLLALGDVAVAKNGTVYVTTGSVFPGGGSVVSFAP
jgi:hypothetical protein